MKTLSRLCICAFAAAICNKYMYQNLMNWHKCKCIFIGFDKQILAYRLGPVPSSVNTFQFQYLLIKQTGLILVKNCVGLGADCFKL